MSRVDGAVTKVDVEELQRQLQEAKALNSHLEQRTTQLEKILLDVVTTEAPQQQQQQQQPPVQPSFDHGQSMALAGSGPRSCTLSRSKSSVAYPAQSMAEDSTIKAHKRQRRAFSQQCMSPPTTHDMVRSVSSRSHSELHNMSFMPRAPVAPMPAPALTRYYSSQEEPANQSLQGGPSQRLASVQENNNNTNMSNTLLGVGMAPLDFLAHFGDEMSNTYMPQGYHLSPNNNYIVPISPSCPSMISGSSADATSPMTRQNSSWGEPHVMARLPSSQSQPDVFIDQECSPTNTNGKRPAPEQILIGLGASLPQAAPHQYGYESSANNLFPSSPKMERSISSTSASSTRSTSSQLGRRAKEARERVLQNSKVAIMPKPSEPAPETSASSTTGASKTEKRDSKIPTTRDGKLSYIRPKHPKVKCDQCNEHPNGFRGDHELRRHVSAKHDLSVKKYVCVDPGSESSVVAINPLDKCKACASCKQYGAYYNAAAHLRRTHFKPKTVRGKTRNTPEERRGGKGGGDWPPMYELKMWFKEIVVQVDQMDTEASEEEDVEEDLGDVAAVPIDIPNAPNASNAMFDGPFDLAMDGTASSFLSTSTGMVLSTQMSPVGSMAEYSPFASGSPMSAMGADFPFTDQDMSAFSSDVAATTMAGSGFADPFLYPL